MRRSASAGESTIGSVFLCASDPPLALAALRPLFPAAPEEPKPDGWIDIPGAVDIFVQPVSPEEVPAQAAFGIRVSDAAAAASSLSTVNGLHISDLFDVAPGCSGFHVGGEGIPTLFVHE